MGGAVGLRRVPRVWLLLGAAIAAVLLGVWKTGGDEDGGARSGGDPPHGAESPEVRVRFGPTGSAVLAAREQGASPWTNLAEQDLAHPVGHDVMTAALKEALLKARKGVSGTSTARLVLDLHAEAPWSYAKWGLQVAVNPRLRVSRVRFVVPRPAEDIDIELPRIPWRPEGATVEATELRLHFTRQAFEESIDTHVVVTRREVVADERTWQRHAAVENAILLKAVALPTEAGSSARSAAWRDVERLLLAASPRGRPTVGVVAGGNAPSGHVLAGMQVLRRIGVRQIFFVND